MDYADKQICCNCRHWRIRAGLRRGVLSSAISECLRHPPVIRGGSQGSPRADATDACGEYEFYITEADVKVIKSHRDELIKHLQYMINEFNPNSENEAETWISAKKALVIVEDHIRHKE